MFNRTQFAAAPLRTQCDTRMQNHNAGSGNLSDVQQPCATALSRTSWDNSLPVDACLQSYYVSADPRLSGVTWRVRWMAAPFPVSLSPGVKNPVRGGARTHQRTSGAFGASTSTLCGFDDAQDAFQNGSRRAPTCRRGLKETQDGLKTVSEGPKTLRRGPKEAKSLVV